METLARVTAERQAALAAGVMQKHTSSFASLASPAASVAARASPLHEAGARVEALETQVRALQKAAAQHRTAAAAAKGEAAALRTRLRTQAAQVDAYAESALAPSPLSPGSAWRPVVPRSPPSPVPPALSPPTLPSRAAVEPPRSPIAGSAISGSATSSPPVLEAKVSPTSAPGKPPRVVPARRPPIARKAPVLAAPPPAEVQQRQPERGATKAPPVLAAPRPAEVQQRRPGGGAMKAPPVLVAAPPPTEVQQRRPPRPPPRVPASALGAAPVLEAPPPPVESKTAPAPPSRPSSALSARSDSPSWIARRVSGWLYPEASHADLGSSLEAYYDETEAKWRFPEEPDSPTRRRDEEPALSPPRAARPTTFRGDSPPAITGDGVAALMAPPARSLPRPKQVVAKNPAPVEYATFVRPPESFDLRKDPA